MPHSAPQAVDRQRFTFTTDPREAEARQADFVECLAELHERWNARAGVQSEREFEHIRGNLQQAIGILIRAGTVKLSGERVILTDLGWAQARALRTGAPTAQSASLGGEAQEGGSPKVTIDLSNAAALITHRSRDGVTVVGRLRENASIYHGRAFVPPAADLVNALYTSAGWRSPGLESEARATRSDIVIAHAGRGGRPGRRPGITWERLVCEVLGELGGHGDWPAIAGAVERRPESEEHVGWREETRQALRNNTTPKGRCYFEVAEIGDHAIYALTEQGSRLAARRTVDDRAPSLSRFLAKAAAPDANNRLTDLELYTLLHLAAELGKPAEARAIYHRFPLDFPDEQRYYMAQHLLDRAEELSKGGG